MTFGETPLSEAEGAILAHSLRLGDRVLKKGRHLTAEDIVALAASGLQSVTAARPEAEDLGENEAAFRLAKAVAGNHVTLSNAFTGRANLFSEVAGLCVVDRSRIDGINGVDEAMTVATLEPYSVVQPKQMVATIKVIPFSAPGRVVEACVAVATQGDPPIRVAPFLAKRAVLIQTVLKGLKPATLDKTAEVTRSRLEAMGSELIEEQRCPHSVAALAPLIAEAVAKGCDLVLVASASAIVDRRDVIPSAIGACGGRIDHFGMPVDPGNLMLMGRLGDVPVLGLPGCARSPRINGFDFILQRLLADLPVGPREIMGMGVGGLLTEIPSRPLPRAKVGLEKPAEEEATAPPHAPRIAALILAAGKSSRMGGPNKLLVEIDGKPMVARSVQAVRGSQASPLFVVVGHQRDRVERALAEAGPLTFVENPDFAGGLSTSVKAGVAALPEDVDGVLVCLGDMPRVKSAEIDRLIEAFNPVEGRAIIVPTRNGQRGNPVIWAKRFFPALQDLTGDMGARNVIAAHPELVAEIEMRSDGVLTDLDTPQAFEKLGIVVPKVPA